MTCCANSPVASAARCVAPTLPAASAAREFVVVMPDTPAEIAAHVAERLRDAVAGAPFRVSASGALVAGDHLRRHCDA